MLEKAPGNLTFEKLRAISLLEGYFKTLHKIIFNDRLMPSIEDLSVIT